MRLATWNCNGALRKKLDQADSLAADILVIQECEDPAQSTCPEYRAWAGDYAWIGYGKNKGIGIFSKSGLPLVKLPWLTDRWEIFLPVKLGSGMKILAVWTQHATPSAYGYIGQFWHYLQLNRHLLDAQTLIAGDFNSSSIWDNPRSAWNHSDCVADLSKLGFESAYHFWTGETQGAEQRPTFYLHRHQSKPYHIDYVFAHRSLLDPLQSAVNVGDPAVWLPYSDHMPVVVNL